MRELLLVCTGGALGSGARFLVASAMLRALGPAFPYGTLTVNVVGSFLLGAIMTAAALTAAVPPDLRLFLSAGVMGGFTTYSSFNYETLTLAAQGRPLAAALNVGVTLAACLVAGAMGIALVRWAA